MPDPRSADPRVPLALERTFLAWLRTALAMMGFGFVVARFGLFLREIEAARGAVSPSHHGISLAMGTSLVALGVAVAAWSILRYRSGLASIEAGESPLARTAAAPSLIALALCAIGAATIWYLLANS